FDGDSTHMLTVGVEGDVVHQDLRTLEVLSRHELPPAEVELVMLHPHGLRAMFVVRAASDQLPSMLVLDLQSGDWRRLGEREVKVMGQDAAGERMACIVMTPR